jgi:hypothetical protein
LGKKLDGHGRRFFLHDPRAIVKEELRRSAATTAAAGVGGSGAHNDGGIGGGKDSGLLKAEREQQLMMIEIQPTITSCQAKEVVVVRVLRECEMIHSIRFMVQGETRCTNEKMVGPSSSRLGQPSQPVLRPYPSLKIVQLARGSSSISKY